MGNNIKDIQQIKSLIAKGKEMGFLTFEEVNKAVPLEMNTPEQFEEIIGIFDQLEIAIVDLEKDGKKIPVTSAETDGEQSEERLELVDNEDAADFSSRSTDPVRMYLREMGAVPLLVTAKLPSPRKSSRASRMSCTRSWKSRSRWKNSSTWAKTSSSTASN